MPNVMGKAMKLQKLILMPNDIVAASSQRTATTSEPMIAGVASVKRKTAATRRITATSAAAVAKGPSDSIDEMISAERGIDPARRGGRALEGSPDFAVARSAAVISRMTGPFQVAWDGWG